MAAADANAGRRRLRSPFGASDRVLLGAMACPVSPGSEFPSFSGRASGRYLESGEALSCGGQNPLDKRTHQRRTRTCRHFGLLARHPRALVGGSRNPALRAVDRERACGQRRCRTGCARPEGIARSRDGLASQGGLRPGHRPPTGNRVTEERWPPRETAQVGRPRGAPRRPAGVRRACESRQGLRPLPADVSMAPCPSIRSSTATARSSPSR